MRMRMAAGDGVVLILGELKTKRETSWAATSASYGIISAAPILFTTRSTLSGGG